MAIKDKIIIPNVPEVLQEQKIQTYVPKASTSQAGIASFRDKDFFVDPKGEVSLSKDLGAIDNKATQALTNSQKAIDTANSAKEVAESAMDMVSDTEGSKVYVEEEFQPEVHVDKDIQTQFNNITDKIPVEASEENPLADKNYLQDQIHKLLSTQIVLGMDGIIEANRVIFTVKDSDSFIEYRTNNREFFVTAYLPVVLAKKEDLDLSMPVNITFGDTTYNLYNYMLGTATTMTIGQLMSTHSYSQATGFFFNFKATFFENPDVVGFGIIPPAIIALQLDNIIEDTDTVVTDLTANNNKLSIHLSAETLNRITKALIKPMANPTVNSVVGLDTTNTQKTYKLGTGLQVVNGDTLQAVLEAGSYTLADATPDPNHQTVTAAEKAQISTNAADISDIKQELDEGDYLSTAGGTITGDLAIEGNLTVNTVTSAGIKLPGSVTNIEEDYMIVTDEAGNMKKRAMNKVLDDIGGSTVLQDGVRIDNYEINVVKHFNGFGRVNSQGTIITGYVQYIRLGNKKGVLTLSVSIPSNTNNVFEEFNLNTIGTLLGLQFKHTKYYISGTWQSIVQFKSSGDTYAQSCEINTDGRVCIGRYYQASGSFGGWPQSYFNNDLINIGNVYVEEV